MYSRLIVPLLMMGLLWGCCLRSYQKPYILADKELQVEEMASMDDPSLLVP